MATMSTTEELLDVFKNMTVLELNEFLKAFEEEFGVTAAAPVAVAAGPAAGGGGGGAAAAEEKDEFDVILAAAGDKKIQVIKEVRDRSRASGSRRPRTSSTAPRSRSSRRPPRKTPRRRRRSSKRPAPPSRSSSRAPALPASERAASGRRSVVSSTVRATGVVSSAPEACRRRARRWRALTLG